MASDKAFAQYVADQMERAGEVTFKSMFGEFGLYLEGKFFGSICDNKVFIKPTDAGRAFIGDVVEAPPYPGARNSFLIEDKLEDRDWLGKLVRVTVGELPEPKPKKKKRK